jgi:hypothetical protein
MSNITIRATGKKTFQAALGVSFGAGSSEDSYPYVAEVPQSTPDMALPMQALLASLDVVVTVVMNTRGAWMVSTIPEGFDKWAQAAGGLVALPLLAAAGVPLPLIPIGVTPVTLEAAMFVIRAVPGAWAWTQQAVAAAIFSLGAGETIATDVSDPGKKYKWMVPVPISLPWEISEGHEEKPIMMAVGMSELVDSNGNTTKFPMVPHVLPLQLMKLGDLVIAAVPAEFTVTAGKRLAKELARTLGGSESKIAIAGYSNGYAGYVTTPEEYEAQEYEGASTLYGKQTLAAYMQEFRRLALHFMAGQKVSSGDMAVAPAITRKKTPKGS